MANKGRVIKHIKRTQGKKAFTKAGTIKKNAVVKALQVAKAKDLKKALTGTNNLKTIKGKSKSKNKGKITQWVK